MVSPELAEEFAASLNLHQISLKLADVLAANMKKPLKAIDEAPFGYFWLLLATFGQLWLIWANLGYFWLLLATFGNFWLCLASDGYYWLLLATFGCFWLLVAIFGYF